MADDKNRLRKTYSFFRQQPVYASGGGGGGGTGGGGDPGASYLVLSLTSSLSNERRFVPSTGLKAVDGGANSNYTLSINDGEVATVSGSTFTGATKHTLGLSGSLTTLVDGTSYLIAGNNISIFSASNGSVTISSTAATNDFFISTTNGSIFTTGSAAFAGNEAGIDSPSDKGTNIFFYVSGSISGSGTADKRALFGGDVIIKGGLTQGYETDAQGFASHAEGFRTVALAITSHAEGIQTVTSGNYSHAEGAYTIASGLSSHAEGFGTLTLGNYSHAEGRQTTTLGIGSHAEGYGTISSGSYQLAAGKYNKRNNDFSLFVIGDGTGDSDASRSDILRINSGSLIGTGRVEVTGSFASTLGLSGSLTRLVDGTSYLVAGTNVIITSASNGSITISSTATGGDSFFSSTTNGSIFTTGSAAFTGNEAGIDSPSDKGTNVFFYISGSISGSGANDKRSLFGGDVVISGSLRQGLLANASGLYSHAEGQTTTASGTAAHAEGASTTASGNAAHAEGANTTASGLYSHAEGLTTTASGIASHAEGQFTIASGWYSHAEGASTTASGIASHAEGSSTEAVGTYSLAAGIGTIASGSGQNVFGQYNLRNNSTSLFIIGDGTSTSNATRGDIVRVNKGISIGRGIVEVTGSFAATLGLSGSLTRLTDGTSYLVAGTNVTISSASNGQVTISSTGGGTPAGSDTELQFNNAGSFGASANLNFNSSTNTLSLTGSFGMKGNVTPDADTTYNLGSSDKRWANVYTGDLHLRNDRGDWTIVEERDYLCVVNNITGKKYKMMLQPIDNES